VLPVPCARPKILLNLSRIPTLTAPAKLKKALKNLLSAKKTSIPCGV